MRYPRLIYIIILIVYTSACADNRERNNETSMRTADIVKTEVFFAEKMKKEYKQYLNFYKKDLVEHFPLEFDLKTMRYITQFNVNDLEYRPPYHYFFRLEKNFSERERNLDSLIYISKEMISAFDTSNLLMFSYLKDPREYCDSISIMGMSQKESTKIGKTNLKKNINTVLPYFSNGYLNEAKTFSGLDSSFVIYILDNAAGIYTDTAFLKQHNYLQKKWKHGYSKGIAVSEKEKSVIYWVTVW